MLTCPHLLGRHIRAVDKHTSQDEAGQPKAPAAELAAEKSGGDASRLGDNSRAVEVPLDGRLLLRDGQDAHPRDITIEGKEKHRHEAQSHACPNTPFAAALRVRGNDFHFSSPPPGRFSSLGAGAFRGLRRPMGSALSNRVGGSFYPTG